MRLISLISCSAKYLKSEFCNYLYIVSNLAKDNSGDEPQGELPGMNPFSMDIIACLAHSRNKILFMFPLKNLQLFIGMYHLKLKEAKIDASLSFTIAIQFGPILRLVF